MGTLYYTNGDVYEGIFNIGLRFGKGNLIYINGD